MIPPEAAGKAAPAVAEELSRLKADVDALARLVGNAEDHAASPMSIFHGYVGALVVAFLVSLFATPLMRRLAVMYGVIDRPLMARKVHRAPIAYLGGVAIYLGMLAAILFSYTQPLHGLMEFHPTEKANESFLPGGVPISVVLGMTVIMMVGLMDDVMKISPRVKVGGQLIAAAALAIEDVGVKVAAGVIVPVGQALGLPTLMVHGVPTVGWVIPIGGHEVPIDLVYWAGTAIIALFVLGACNAANLIDGLDGLLTGTTAIASTGLLIIALTLAVTDDGPRDASRIILCLALLGACLGFLPHNFNPASIFLGDCGSLLLGYCTIVIILSLGDTGWTQLVLAGLVIYALPIIDTTLAIARRKVSGRKISDADDQHLHHMLKRALGVKGAVLALYGIAAGFAALGVALSEGRGRVTYAITLIFAAFIGVTSFKVARKEQIEREAAAFDAKGGPAGAGPNKPPREDDGHRRNIAQAEVPGAEPGSDGLILPACPSPLPSPSASSP